MKTLLNEVQPTRPLRECKGQRRVQVFQDAVFSLETRPFSWLWVKKG
jgi:hypothetical protein